MRHIALISGSIETSKALYKQLKDFIPNEIQIDVYIGDDGIAYIEPCEIQIFSSKSLYEEVYNLDILDSSCPQIIGQRTINYDQLDTVVSVPDRADVLLVNDLELTARESLFAMEEIGLNHMNLQIYYPESDFDTSNFNIAITPGEIKYVPLHIEKIINIGPRIFDFITIAKILTHLNLLEISSGSFSKLYLEKIIKIAKGLAQSRSEVVKLNSHLEQVIDSFNEGLLMFNPEQKIVLFNDVLKQILKVKKYMYIGNTIQRVIHNKKLLLYLMDEKELSPLNISLDGNDYVVSKFNIDQNDLRCATFKSLKDHNLTKKTKTEAIRKGYIAKYELEDIVGKSESVNHIRDIILKLGKTDMNILIQGESGTGKELTASAIHNNSNRKDNPFLAVNFSALPDDLIESELFGYSEGAFTGAKVGGKRGIFEEANGGTIFLDEIGDISLKVQLRLLRVLEEKEIMPIGANEIRPIDVRIVAATNKNLDELVIKKIFREDLYYRLKMGFIHLQPLRERFEDIEELSYHIAQSMATSNVSFDKNLIDNLKEYHWPGNIRELKNTIVYMLAVRSSDILTIEDLPAGKFFSKVKNNENTSKSNTLESLNDYKNSDLEINIIDKKTIYDEIDTHQFELAKKIFLTDEEILFLDLIYEFTKKDITISRQSLSKSSINSKYIRTENQVRRIVKGLKDKMLIEIHKGRMGITLSQQGYEYYRNK